MSENRKAVVLMSGGIDSATCMAMAVERHDEVIPVHIDYGQQTADLEAKMASKLCDHFHREAEAHVPKAPIIDYHGVFKHFAGGVAKQDKEFGHMNEDDGRSSGYVPMRNLHLIATAAAIADVEEATNVYHGAQGGDEEDYPDCRQEFMDSAAGAIGRSVPEHRELNLMTPLISLSKVEVIQKADDFDVPFEYTYSCYTEVDSIESPEPCGNCPACVERAKAFDEAGVNDPHATEIKP